MPEWHASAREADEHVAAAIDEIATVAGTEPVVIGKSLGSLAAPVSRFRIACQGLNACSLSSPKPTSAPNSCAGDARGSTAARPCLFADAAMPQHGRCNANRELVHGEGDPIPVLVREDITDNGAITAWTCARLGFADVTCIEMEQGEPTRQREPTKLRPRRAVAYDLRAKIAAGKIKGKLPTRVQFAAQYGVSDMTIGAAIRVLKDEGLLTSVPGLGVYVRE